ncbi:uncharacterized protein LOC117509349 [Thalassophryne amazonica]|uniref:uncharacterized protein LOC117509349 n=1 Tax=Thalassophryne amazonica TaxID=390379 RepID=UPI0014719A2B|nr:uncharacterized protein LOC117509349 [Thalassophryne amazonica]
MANWEIDLNLRRNLIGTIDELLRIRRSQIDWLDNFIDEVKTQEVIINSGKTASTAIAIASTVALFTPFAVFGAIGLAASSVGGVGFALGDFIANKIQNSNLEDQLKESKSVEQKLSDLLEDLNSAAKRLSQQLGCTVEMARRLILYMKEIHDISVDQGDDFLHIGANGTTAVIDLLVTVPHLKRVADAMNFGYGFYNAAKISSAANVAMVIEGGEAVYQLSGAFIGLASKTLAIVGSVVGVADVIYSWAKDNPNLASAKDCLKKVKENKRDLEAMRRAFNVRFEDL